MYTGLINLIKHVHCSKDKPQNYNVYLTNFKGKYIKIFKDNMWLIDDMDDVIDQLKDDKISILNKKVEELNDLKLKQTLETFKGRLYSNAVAEKNLNNNIKLVLYNNKDNNGERHQLISDEYYNIVKEYQLLILLLIILTIRNYLFFFFFLLTLLFL